MYKIQLWRSKILLYRRSRRLRCLPYSLPSGYIHPSRPNTLQEPYLQAGSRNLLRSGHDFHLTLLRLTQAHLTCPRHMLRRRRLNIFHFQELLRPRQRRFLSTSHSLFIIKTTWHRVQPRVLWDRLVCQPTRPPTNKVIS